MIKLLTILLMLPLLCCSKEQIELTLTGEKITKGTKKGKIYDINILTVTGSRSKEDIITVINDGKLSLNKIYSEFLDKKPDFSGKILLKLTIAENGSITNADIVHSTTEYAEFDEAIRKEISTWKWKLIKKGNTTVTAILYFTE